MKKSWKNISTWGESCPECGADAEVLTDAPEQMAWDGDEARCEECHYPGSITCIDIDEAYVNWLDT
jgi:hypothetical protein